jgi:drug/metabolite transporter (DMT)-like permease
MLPSALAAASRHGAPIALLVLVNLLFSGYAVLASAAFKSGTSPVVFALLRDLIACALFLAALAHTRPARLLPRAEHLGFFVALAVTGVWGSQLMSALCISYLSAPIYGLLKPAVPVVTLVVAAAVGVTPFDLRTRPTQLTVVGVLLAISGGAAIVAASFTDRESKNAALGAGYVSVYMLCAGSYPIVQKAMLKSFDYEPLVLVAWAYLIGTGMIFACVVVVAPPPEAWVVSSAGLGGLFFSGALSSFFNYWAMSWINKRTSPVLVSAAYPLQSFFVPLLSSVFLGAEIFPSDFAGGAVVIAGLALCIRAQMLEAACAATEGGAKATAAEYAAPLLEETGEGAGAMPTMPDRLLLPHA